MRMTDRPDVLLMILTQKIFLTHSRINIERDSSNVPQRVFAGSIRRIWRDACAGRQAEVERWFSEVRLWREEVIPGPEARSGVGEVGRSALRPLRAPETR